MNTQINLLEKKWVKKRIGNNIFYFSGSFFYKDNLYYGEEAIELISDSLISNQLNKIILNGFFSFIIETEKNILLSTDHIRSKPIFYSINRIKNTVLISDNAEEIRRELKLRTINDIKKNEILLTGYVTGNATIFSEISQIQAGEILSIDKEDYLTKSSQHYNFYNKELEHYDDIELFKKHKIAIEHSIKRLIHYANGRQIVLPLSAGHDSQFILTLLKKQKYENVLTFTYGKKNNKEAIISKERADALGYKWIFIEYNKKIWSEEWENSKSIQYELYSGNCSSLPHIQDYIAVKKLQQSGELQTSAIFTPGHCITGAEIPDFLFSCEKKYTINQVSNFIYNKHYINDSTLKKSASFIYIKEIEQYLKNIEFNGSPEAFANLIEHWGWKERESKYIINSLKIYTFFGYEYWFPLWDREYADFWESVPMVLRRDRYWYNNYIEEFYNSIISEKDFLPKSFAYKKIEQNIFLKTIKKSKILTQLIKRFRNGILLLNHPLCFNNIMKNKDIIISSLKNNHILLEYTKKFLKHYK